MVTAKAVRYCGCGKEAEQKYGGCSCECHTGDSYEKLLMERTAVHEFPWGKVKAVRYDHRLNLLANFRDSDGGVSISIEFNDGCTGGESLPAERLPAYIEQLRAATPKLVAALEKRAALGDRIRPLQRRHSAQADIMLAVVKV